MPDPKELNEHINSLLNGKLGHLAGEIAKETADKIMNDVEFIHYNSKYKNKDCVVKKITKTVEMEELECLERK